MLTVPIFVSFCSRTNFNCSNRSLWASRGHPRNLYVTPWAVFFDMAVFLARALSILSDSLIATSYTLGTRRNTLIASPTSSSRFGWAYHSSVLPIRGVYLDAGNVSVLVFLFESPSLAMKPSGTAYRSRVGRVWSPWAICVLASVTVLYSAIWSCSFSSWGCP